MAQSTHPAALLEASLQRLQARFTVDLHPSKLAAPMEGVREHLDGLLLRYNEDFGGVLLAYSNVKLLTSAGTVLPYFPYLRVVVSADAVLFNPAVGQRLVGTVNKIANDYIGVVVLGFVNTSIGAAHVRSELRPRLGEGRWASTRDAAHAIEVGTDVAFTLQGIQHGDYISLVGSLKEGDTGAVEYLKAQEVAAAGKKKEKRSKGGAEQGGEQQGQKKAKKRRAEGGKPGGSGSAAAESAVAGKANFMGQANGQKKKKGVTSDV